MTPDRSYYHREEARECARIINGMKKRERKKKVARRSLGACALLFTLFVCQHSESWNPAKVCYCGPPHTLTLLTLLAPHSRYGDKIVGIRL